MGVRAIGAASKKHFDLVRELGAEPIESRGAPLATQVHALVPGGVDVTFDGLGGAGTRECIRATRKGGLVIGYGFMAAQKDGRSSMLATLRGMAALFLGARLAGRRSTFYGITRLYRKDPRPFREDLTKLLELLRERRIQPKTAARLPLLAGVEAQKMLLAGDVAGKIVLLRDIG